MTNGLADVLASLRDVGFVTLDCNPTPGTRRDKTCMLCKAAQKNTAPTTTDVTRADCSNVMHERSMGRDGLSGGEPLRGFLGLK